MKKVVQDLTSGGIDWQREKWQAGLGSKFIRQGEKNAVKYADEIIVLSKGVQDYFKNAYKALVFRKSDIKDLQEKLQNACDHPEKVDGYKKQAADFICNKYNWDDVVEETMKLYRRK